MWEREVIVGLSDKAEVEVGCNLHHVGRVIHFGEWNTKKKTRACIDRIASTERGRNEQPKSHRWEEIPAP